MYLTLDWPSHQSRKRLVWRVLRKSSITTLIFLIWTKCGRNNQSQILILAPSLWRFKLRELAEKADRERKPEEWIFQWGATFMNLSALWAKPWAYRQNSHKCCTFQPFQTHISGQEGWNHTLQKPKITYLMWMWPMQGNLAESAQLLQGGQECIKKAHSFGKMLHRPQAGHFLGRSYCLRLQVAAC